MKGTTPESNVVGEVYTLTEFPNPQAMTKKKDLSVIKTSHVKYLYNLTKRKKYEKLKMSNSVRF